MLSSVAPTPIPESIHGNPSIYTIQNENYSERTPLLNGPSPIVQIIMQICDKIFLAILFSILVFGLVIGTYLLVMEGHQHIVPNVIVYNLTSRELWKAHVPSTTMTKLKLPVQRVLFLQSNNSRGCDSKSHCIKLVQELQLQHMAQQREPDINYNFVVSGDGTIYEGRGWKFESNFSHHFSSNAVAIAFVGTLHGNSLTRKQAASTKLFMNEATLERKLERCVDFQIWGDDRFSLTLRDNIKNVLSICGEVR